MDCRWYDRRPEHTSPSLQLAHSPNPLLVGQSGAHQRCHRPSHSRRGSRVSALSSRDRVNFLRCSQNIERAQFFEYSDLICHFYCRKATKILKSDIIQLRSEGACFVQTADEWSYQRKRFLGKLSFALAKTPMRQSKPISSEPFPSAKWPAIISCNILAHYL